MSVLGLDSGYTAKYGLTPPELPWAQAIFRRISLLSSQYSYSILPRDYILSYAQFSVLGNTLVQGGNIGTVNF